MLIHHTLKLSNIKAKGTNSTNIINAKNETTNLNKDVAFSSKNVTCKQPTKTLIKPIRSLSFKEQQNSHISKQEGRFVP